MVLKQHINKFLFDAMLPFSVSIKDHSLSGCFYSFGGLFSDGPGRQHKAAQQTVKG